MSSKPVFYTFGLSVWSAAPELALVELGYTDEIEKQNVEILDGGNFELDYVTKTSTATVPLIITPDGTTYPSTVETVQYLIKNAPEASNLGSTPDATIIEIIHEDNVDPNFALIAARGPQELAAKAASVPGYHVRKRQEVLDRVAPTAPAELKEFYDAKLTLNNYLSSVYADGAPSEITQGYFAKSQANWDAVGNFIFSVLPSYLEKSGPGPFLGGDKPGEADFHIAAWIAHIGAVIGTADKGIGGWKAFSVFKDGKEVPASVGAFWDAWAERKSWNSVYATGLH